VGSGPLDAQGPRAADGVLEQLECHAIADGQILEFRPLAQVAAMEEDLEIALRPDEAMSLSEHERDDAAGARRAAAFRRGFRRGSCFPDSGRAAIGHRLIADATAACGRSVVRSRYT